MKSLNAEPISTDHLLLVVLTADVVEALLHDRERASALLGWSVPGDWPEEDLREILPGYVETLRRDPSGLPWGMRAIVLREKGCVIGGIGCIGAPDASGAVEIGYGMLPAYRGRGYATEAARALAAWCLAAPDVRRVTAGCEPTNAASIRVLEKAGFTRCGEEGELLRWSIEPT